MITLVIAAAAVAAQPSTPSHSMSGMHAQHRAAASKGKDCCKDCCKDMAKKH
ncbi:MULTISPECIES: hypothetical protein [Sphingomonas]|uniref:hypothetical protein n=1 Tax=Sphingomonas TaxID=13687 RepID=UPI0013B43011|nr:MULTISPECIES: hypothetical protein [Sphingomonas]